MWTHRLQIDYAYQLAAREHRHRQLRAYSIHGRKVTRVIADIARQNRFALCRRRTRDTLTDRDHEAAYNLIPVPARIANRQPMDALAIKQDRKDVVRDDSIDCVSHGRQHLIEIESLRCDRDYFEQKVQ